MKIEEFMYLSGCNMALRGYEYLKNAIEIRMENPDMTVQEIFRKTADCKNKTFWAVKQSVDRTIQTSYPDMDKGLKDKLFRSKESVATGEYIKVVAYSLKNNLI